jgi:hypothetical protein
MLLQSTGSSRGPLFLDRLMGLHFGAKSSPFALARCRPNVVSDSTFGIYLQKDIYRGCLLVLSLPGAMADDAELMCVFIS